MNRKSFFVIIVIAAVVAGATAFAQQHRAYNLIMKDVAATFANVRKNIEANNAPAVAEDAAKLEGYFAETEAFWAPFNTKDASEFAKSAREAAAAMGTAAKGNDIKAATASSAAVQRTCGGCHGSHREQTATGFIIKP